MKYTYYLIFASLFLSNNINAQTRRDKLISTIHQYMAQIDAYTLDEEKYPIPAGKADQNLPSVKKSIEKAEADHDSIYALRKKIILLSQKIKPALAIPERARESYIQGVTLLDDPATKEYNDAISDLASANVIAPWWADTYKQLGKLYEIIKEYSSSIDEFQLYLLTNPPAKEARDVQDEIYIIEAKMKAND